MHTQFFVYFLLERSPRNFDSGFDVDGRAQFSLLQQLNYLNGGTFPIWFSVQGDYSVVNPTLADNRDFFPYAYPDPELLAFSANYRSTGTVDLLS